MIFASHRAIVIKAPTKLLCRLVGIPLLISAGLFALPSQAEEEPGFLPSTDTFRFNSRNTFYETRKYSRNFNIKGWEISEGIYFGQTKIAGKGGPGLVFEKEGYSWGFNHCGVELLIKF